MTAGEAGSLLSAPQDDYGTPTDDKARGLGVASSSEAPRFLGKRGLVLRIAKGSTALACGLFIVATCGFAWLNSNDGRRTSSGATAALLHVPDETEAAWEGWKRDYASSWRNDDSRKDTHAQVAREVSAMDELPTSASDWLRHVWQATADDAHTFWMKRHWAQHKEQSRWWDQEMSEKQWYNHSLHQLRSFGDKVQSWSAESDNAIDRTNALQDGFDAFWRNATAQDRKWWNQTQRAFAEFNKTDPTLWWNMTWHSSLSSDSRRLQEESASTERWRHSAESWYDEHTARALSENVKRPNLYLNSTDAYGRIGEDSTYDHSADFFLLQQGWDAQINQAYCGVASSAAVLNSYKSLLLDGRGGSLPIDPVYSPYPYATQHDLVNNPCVYDDVIHVNETFDGILHAPFGLSLVQVRKLLECHVPAGWTVRSVHVGLDVSVDDLRAELVKALEDPFSRVLVNADRRGLKQAGGGHFSPIGAYSSSTDSFLFMDVSKYKYPPVWTSAYQLHKSLQSLDACVYWNFPKGQDQIQDARFLAPATPDEMVVALTTLQCQPDYRGYIIVTAADTA